MYSRNNYKKQKNTYIDTVNQYRDLVGLEDGTVQDNEMVENHFRIIEKCADKSMYAINNIKPLDSNIYNQFLINDSSQNTYFITDIHGDLTSLLVSLTGNLDNTKNPARFKSNKPPVIYRDISTNPAKIYEDISEIINSGNNLLNLIPIANLESNPEFKGTFICGGDLIDRGSESESCFYTFENLLNRNKSNGKDTIELIYEIGNHEELVLLNDYRSSIENDFTCIIGRKYEQSYPILRTYSEDEIDLVKSRIKYMHENLKIMLENDNIKLMHTKNNNIFCHAVVKEHIIINILNQIVIKYEENDEILRSNFTDVDINFIKLLYLNSNKELNENSPEETKILVKILNTFAKCYFNLKLINSDKIKIYQNFFEPLLWEKEKESRDDLNAYPLKKIKGVNMFVVGHDIQMDFKAVQTKDYVFDRQAKLKNGYLFADIATSNGFRFNNNTSISSVVQIDQNNNIIISISIIDRAQLYTHYKKGTELFDSFRKCQLELLLENDKMSLSEYKKNLENRIANFLNQKQKISVINVTNIIFESDMFLKENNIKKQILINSVINNILCKEIKENSNIISFNKQKYLDLISKQLDFKKKMFENQNFQKENSNLEKVKLINFKDLEEQINIMEQCQSTLISQIEKNNSRIIRRIHK